MNRREALARLVAATAVPALHALTADDLLALGTRVHGLAASRAQSRYLDAHRFATVTAVAERIVPETETPGATAAGAHLFIDLLVGEWYDNDERARFLAGLDDLDARSLISFGAPFADGMEAQQVALLERLEEETLGVREVDPERARDLFFPEMKWLTLFAYYTSQAGATEELHYTVIPGSYRGCEPRPPHVHG